MSPKPTSKYRRGDSSSSGRKSPGSENRRYKREGIGEVQGTRNSGRGILTHMPNPPRMSSGKASVFDGVWKQITTINPDLEKRAGKEQKFYGSLANPKGIKYLEFRRDYWRRHLTRLRGYARRKAGKVRQGDASLKEELEDRIAKITSYLKYARSKQ
ncbi:MAG: hypothetical protein CL944_01055 [Candidatus Diapherotrites archaeon]|uniref:Uncharacterized protein n=1 Tax=Candidatus Iainarchaeum sp. TaxID=3101447 RepID=A0A2D6LPM3_9ARCH|nr:hypothetical protein [Candidatus Diapherotrites archaeon]|tara:strand:+ start:973 stop:1443 length:471 start_codon:yes stop_codon:yes gene_type:complete